MTRFNPTNFLGLLLTVLLAGCKTSAPINPLAIVREETVADEWIDPGAVVEPMADGFGEITAIAWSPHNGFMIIADREKNVLWKFVDGRGVSVYFKPAGRPIGVEYDTYDRLVVHQDSGVIRLDKSGQIRPLDPSKPRRPYLLDAQGFQWTIVDGVATLLDKNGAQAGRILIPDPVVSFCWGDDGHSIYVSTTKAVYRVKTKLTRTESK